MFDLVCAHQVKFIFLDINKLRSSKENICFAKKGVLLLLFQSLLREVDLKPVSYSFLYSKIVIFLSCENITGELTPQKTDLCIYVKGRVRERLFIHQLVPMWPQQLGLGLARSQGYLPGLPQGCRSPRPQTILHCSRRCICRKLDQKEGSSQDSSWFPYGMQALQAVT